VLVRAGVLTLTAGGTVLELHQLAFLLSLQLPFGTLNWLLNCDAPVYILLTALSSSMDWKFQAVILLTWETLQKIISWHLKLNYFPLITKLAMTMPMNIPNIAPSQGLEVTPQVFPEHLPR
jgi:hypothetical protein